MANNIGTSLTFCVCVATQPVRIVGTPESGELDGRSIITSTNTKTIFYYNNAGTLQTCTPGNNFSAYKVMQPGHAVAIVGKLAFELPLVFPLPDPTQQSAALAALQSVLANTPAPNPEPSPVPSGLNGTIAITSPNAGASVTAGNITVSGTYTLTTAGTLSAIQARWNGGTWVTLQSNPTGGNYTGSMAVTTGTGNIEVRFADNTAVTASRSITVTAVSPTPSPEPSPQPSPNPAPAITPGSGTAGTLTLTAPATGSTFASGNVLIEGNVTINGGQTVTSLEWSFNGGNWVLLLGSPTAGTFSRSVAIDTTVATTGLLAVRFSNEQAVVSSTTITVNPPVAPPAAVASQTINIAANGFTASELDTNWNRFVSVGGTEQIVNNRFLPTGNTNSQVAGRGSYKTPFQITSTAAQFSLFAKVILDGQDSTPSPTLQANYTQGFGIGFHNDLTPLLTANVNTNFGIRDLTRCLSLEFSPPTNQIQLWRNISNPTTVFAATTTATASNGIIYGTVYVWVDLVATTHVLNVYLANTNTKPATPDLTVDLDSTAIGPLATYFNNQAFLAFGGQTLFTGAQASATKPYRLEELTFSSSNA